MKMNEEIVGDHYVRWMPHGRILILDEDENVVETMIHTQRALTSVRRVYGIDLSKPNSSVGITGNKCTSEALSPYTSISGKNALVAKFVVNDYNLRINFSTDKKHGYSSKFSSNFIDAFELKRKTRYSFDIMNGEMSFEELSDLNVRNYYNHYSFPTVTVS